MELRLATLQQFMTIAREMERANNGSHAYFQVNSKGQSLGS